MQWVKWATLAFSFVSAIAAIIGFLHWYREEALQPQRAIHITAKLDPKQNNGLLYVRPNGKYYMELAVLRVIRNGIPQDDNCIHASCLYINRDMSPMGIRVPQVDKAPVVALLSWRRQTFFGRYMKAEAMRITINFASKPINVQVENWHWSLPEWAVRFYNQNRNKKWMKIKPGKWVKEKKAWAKSVLPADAGFYPKAH